MPGKIKAHNDKNISNQNLDKSGYPRGEKRVYKRHLVGFSVLTIDGAAYYYVKDCPRIALDRDGQGKVKFDTEGYLVKVDAANGQDHVDVNFHCYSTCGPSKNRWPNLKS